MNKYFIFLAVSLLWVTNAFSFTKLVGHEVCLGLNQITHTPGSDWQLSENASGWNIIQSDKDSRLQLSSETPVERTVEPYHNPFTRKLAIVTCRYANDILVLRRTYEESTSPFPDANYIAADSNVDSKGNFNSVFFNSATSCPTSMGDLNKCAWFFLESLSDVIPEGFYGSTWLR